MNVMQKIACAVGAIVFLVVLLPASPVQQFVSEVQDAVPTGYLNWFFPVGFCVTTLLAWTLVISAYYLVSWALRAFDIIK